MIFDLFKSPVRGGGGRGYHAFAEPQKIVYFSDDDGFGGDDKADKVQPSTVPSPRKPPARRASRRHADRAGRRRSANADILESLGLPSTVSYQDMKTLQDGLCVDDILGRSSSCCCCRRRCRRCHHHNHHNHHHSCSGCFRGAAEAARRASQSSIATVARWTRKASPPAVYTRLHKKASAGAGAADADAVPSAAAAPAVMAAPQRPTKHCALCAGNLGANPSRRPQEEDDGMRLEDQRTWKADTLPQPTGETRSMPPGQWLRQRSTAPDVTALEKKD